VPAPMPTEPPEPSQPPGGPLSFLALGDSYTVGEGVPPEEAWPARLVERLRGEGVEVADPRVVARTGWSAGELEAGMEEAGLREAVPRGPWALVTLMVGVNDHYRGGDPAPFREVLRRLVRRGVGLAGGDPRRLLLLSIPDWGGTPFAREEGRDPALVAGEVDTFNRVLRGEAVAVGAGWVDVTGTTREVAGDAAFLAPDGLHPGGELHARWVERILPEARRALGVGPRRD